MTLSSTVGSFDHPLMSEGVQHLLASIEDGIFVLDKNFHLVYFNQPARRHIFNFYSFFCEIGEDVIPLLPEERRGPIKSYFEKVLEGESIRYVHEIPKEQNFSLWVDCHYFPMRNSWGHIIGIGGMLKDITERRTYRLELEQKSLEMSSILQSITDGFFTMDRNWIIRYANRQAAALVGLNADDAIGKSMKELFPNPSTFIFFSAYQKAFDTGLPVRAEGYFAPMDKWLDITVYPSKDLLTIYGRDITEKRKLEEKLLQLKLAEQKMVIQATIEGQEKERELLSTELHDNVSQVLTTTKLYLEMAAAKENSHYEIMKKSIDNLTVAINDLRLISYSLIPSSINDIGIIDSIKELIEPYKGVQKFEIHFAYEGDFDFLPPSFKVNLFRIIQERLHFLAINSGASNVWIGLHSKDSLELAIKDDSIEKEKSGAAEINFATIRNRTELYDGTATICTSPGKGCIITLDFPLPDMKMAMGGY